MSYEEQQQQESVEEILLPNIEPEDIQSTNILKSTTKKKQRKPQTEEEYAIQISQWNKTGPLINTDTWLFENLNDLNIDIKIDRLKLLHSVELAYYRRDYNKCLELLEIGENLYLINLEEVGDYITNDYKSSSKQIKWNKKLEKNIMELYNIKKKCINKLNI